MQYLINTFFNFIHKITRVLYNVILKFLGQPEILKESQLLSFLRKFLLLQRAMPSSTDDILEHPRNTKNNLITFK